jgi:hypothetical protein
MRAEPRKTELAMSPQETQQQPIRGLFKHKAHFRVPSAEGTFAFPRDPRSHEDSESAGEDLNPEEKSSSQ